MNHVISTKQFLDRKVLDAFLALALDSEGMRASYVGGRIMASLFYEPSTRTRFSFEAAMLRLGGQVISSDHAGSFSSAIKGETLEDSIRIISGDGGINRYADIIVLRHPEAGAAERAASVSGVPLINAGDGDGEHPTQALLDIYTIKKELGRIDNLHVCLAGDLKYGRTVHSLIHLLAAGKNNRVTLAFPEPLDLPDDYRNVLVDHGMYLGETYDLEDALRDNPDVVYMTRVQKERFDSKALYDDVRNAFVFDEPLLSCLDQNAILMHPLPRVNEIAPEVDTDPRAAYFRQAQNGLPVRIALLRMLLLGGK